MKWVADITLPKPVHCVIEQQSLHALIPGQSNQLGFYLYIFEAGGKNYDYLQDTFDKAKEFALKKFQIPTDSWKQLE